MLTFGCKFSVTCFSVPKGSSTYDISYLLLSFTVLIIVLKKFNLHFTTFIFTFSSSSFLISNINMNIIVKYEHNPTSWYLQRTKQQIGDCFERIFLPELILYTLIPHPYHYSKTLLKNFINCHTLANPKYWVLP